MYLQDSITIKANDVTLHADIPAYVGTVSTAIVDTGRAVYLESALKAVVSADDLETDPVLDTWRVSWRDSVYKITEADISRVKGRDHHWTMKLEVPS